MEKKKRLEKKAEGFFPEEDIVVYGNISEVMDIIRKTTYHKALLDTGSDYVLVSAILPGEENRMTVYVWKYRGINTSSDWMYRWEPVDKKFESLSRVIDILRKPNR